MLLAWSRGFASSTAHHNFCLLRTQFTPTLTPHALSFQVKYVLSIDGGGVKGLIAARILMKLEADLGRPLKEVFDFFCGCSIGAVLACGLLFTDLSAKDIAEKVFTIENAKKFFPKDLSDKIFNVLQTKPKYNGKFKAKLINEILPHKSFAEATPKGKHVMVPVFDCSRGRPVFVSDYHESYKILNVNTVCDASSAAPAFFPSVYMGSEGRVCGIEYGIDGGLFANNPADCAYADAIRLYPGEEICMLSISCGNPPFKAVGRGLMEDISITGKTIGAFGKIRSASRRIRHAPGSETLKWGGIQWFQKGDLMGIVFAGSVACIDYRMRVLTEAMGHKYIRVNPIVEFPVDETSTRRLTFLVKVADDYYAVHGAQVVAMFKAS